MDERRRVLVVDDDRCLCQLLRDYLALHGYDVSSAHTGIDGVNLALSSDPDAIILDVMLPGIDGFEVMRRIRHRSNVPILMLTARGEEPDRIEGLNKGADDYLPKTFSRKELLARLNAVIRRASESRRDENYSIGELAVDSARREARLNNVRLDLTAVEFDMLLALLRAGGRVLSREQLLQEACKRGLGVSDRSVDVHISSLRRKLGDELKSPRYIETIRNIGYRLTSPEGA